MKIEKNFFWKIFGKFLDVSGPQMLKIGDYVPSQNDNYRPDAPLTCIQRLQKRKQYVTYYFPSKSASGSRPGTTLTIFFKFDHFEKTIWLKIG